MIFDKRYKLFRYWSAHKQIRFPVKDHAVLGQDLADKLGLAHGGWANFQIILFGLEIYHRSPPL